MVDLRKAGEQIKLLWVLSGAATNVPLSLAAAMVFHEMHDDSRAVLPRPEYEDALDLLAAALSSLVPVYTVDGGTEGHVAMRFDLGCGRFRNGATVYEQRNNKPVTFMLVRREHLPGAIELIKATGIPFRVAGR